MSEEHSKTTIVIANIIFVFLVVGSYFLFTTNQTKNSTPAKNNQEGDQFIQFSEVKNKSKARQLRNLMPQPNEFDGDFSITADRFKEDNRFLTYSTDWQNGAASKIKAYRNGSTSRPKNLQNLAKKSQFFTLSISYAGTSTDNLDNLKEDFSQLPDTAKRFIEKDIVSERDLPKIGTAHFSYRLSQPANPTYRDYYNFYRNGYIVRFSMFTSLNENAFAELILPKAELIDVKIQNIK